MNTTVKLGDWVQADERITEILEDGEELVHAEKGGIGHVMGVREGCATVTWERTGTTTDCFLEEFHRLCDMHAGKENAPTQQTGAPMASAVALASCTLQDMLLSKRVALEAMERHRPRFWENSVESIKREIFALETAVKFVRA